HELLWRAVREVADLEPAGELDGTGEADAVVALVDHGARAPPERHLRERRGGELAPQDRLERVDAGGIDRRREVLQQLGRDDVRAVGGVELARQAVTAEQP